jgi:hypothetical protein
MDSSALATSAAVRLTCIWGRHFVSTLVCSCNYSSCRFKSAVAEGVRFLSPPTNCCDTISSEFKSRHATDPRLWHEDRLHANALGHTRIADALAFALELPGTDDSWGTDLPLLPPQTLAQKIAAEVSWWRRYLLPWIGKGASARIMAGNRGFPVPTLAPVLSASGSEREDVL